MAKSLLTHRLALLAFTGFTVVRCQADIALCTNLPPTFPYDSLLATNAPLALSTTNLPPLALEVPPLRGDLKPPIIPPSPPLVLTPSPTHAPGIYLAAPYTMQVKVPDNIDPGMAHFPNGNLTFRTPAITPDEQLKRP